MHGFGSLEILVISLALGLNVLHVAGIVSAAMFNNDAWARTSHTKFTWIFFLVVFGFPVAAAYFVLVRPGLKASALDDADEV